MEIVFNAIILVLFGAVGFILKNIFNDVKRHGEDIGKLKGKVDLVNQGAIKGLDKLTDITTLKIVQLTNSVDRQCGQVKDLTKTVNQLHGLIKARDSEIIREFKDLKKILK